MSTFPDHADEVLKSADDLAEGINKDTLRLRAVRIDRILNGEIMPYLAVHIALIGACIVIARFGSWPSLFILFSSIVAGLSVAYFVSRLRAQRQTGIPGHASLLRQQPQRVRQSARCKEAFPWPWYTR
jgi:hypothetical protein